MRIALRHIFLFLGVIATIFSFLFFGRAVKIYAALLFGGLITSAIAYLIIVFSTDSVKNKIVWTLFVIGSVLLQRLTEPLLTRKSYDIFVTRNQNRLTKINDLILAKTDNLIFIPNSEISRNDSYSVSEIEQMRELLMGTGVSRIERDSQKIYYQTYGMLDVSNGVYYFYSATSKPDKRFRHIFGKWFY